MKEIAQIGAALGREFSHGLLAAVADRPEAELQAALDQLVAAELVYRRGTPPDVTYSFKHALVQDAAYGALLKSRRQHLHARIAQVMEEKFPEIVEPSPNSLRTTTPARALRNKRLSTGERLANAPSRARPTQRRSSASRRRWSCLKRCRRPPSAYDESWPCRHALARPCKPSRALRRRMWRRLQPGARAVRAGRGLPGAVVLDAVWPPALPHA